MAVILTVTTTPSSFTSGNFPLTTMQSGPAWRFTMTPSLVSSDAAYGAFQALFATNDSGGLYLVGSSTGNNRRVQFFNGSGGGTKVVESSIITWSASQAITVTLNLAAGTNASSLIVAGATTGNGTTAFTTSGTYFTATTLGVGQFTNSNTFRFSGTIGNMDDTAPAGASGSANVGGITGSGAAITGTLASGSASVGGITGSGSASSPGTASGSGAVGGISSSGGAASPALATGTSAVGGITGAGSAGQSLFGTIGASSAGQRADQTAPTTGTLTTGFVARTPSATVAVNDRLAFNSRRWHVNTGGTLSSGSGPTGTGSQTDGTATLVALTSTDTALTMTTQTSNSVMVAILMRELWNSDQSAPTDSKGNTYTLKSGPNFYSGFPSAASAVYAKTGATGGAGHTLSATWPQKSATGAELSLLAIEVPTGRSSSIVQAVSFVERTTATSVTSASVTTTGPAVLVAAWLGTGNVLTVGLTHAGAPSSPFTQILNADTAVAIHNNGYVQAKAAFAFVADAGTYTATWTGTTGTGGGEGAQLYLIAIQEAPGTLASGAAAVGGVTSSGLTGPGASGSAASGGITSTGVAGSSAAAATANGGGPVGGVSSSGVTAVASFGATTVGGISSSGNAITGTQASGSAAVGGIQSSGLAVVPGEASGLSAVGGISSAGLANSGSFASGAAAVGGITSLGSAQTSRPPNWSTTFAAAVMEIDKRTRDRLGGIAIIYRPAASEEFPVVGIFDENYILVTGDPPAGVETIGPAIFLRLDELPVDPENDEPILVIGGAEYDVIECKPDGIGGIVLRLRKVTS